MSTLDIIFLSVTIGTLEIHIGEIECLVQDLIEIECRNETATRNVAKHIVYLYTELGHTARIPDYVKDAADNAWDHLSKLDEMTAFLCETIENESVHDVHAIMYNGRKKKSRALADWWESHKELDKKRKEVIDSLTPRQRNLLNL